MPAPAGMSGGYCSRRSATQFRFTFQTARLRRRLRRAKLRRPVSLRRRVRRRVREDPHRPEEEPRARGTPGVQLDPRASTPRDIEACRSPVCSPSALVRAIGKACRKSAKPKASRARCFRLAPHPPRWSAPPREGETYCVTLHRLWAQALGGTPVTGALSAYRPSRPPACGSARQKRRGLDRRAPASHLRCKVMSRPPLPAPRLETLIRHPSVTGRDNPRNTYAFIYLT